MTLEKEASGWRRSKRNNRSELDSVRNEIDELDRQIAALLNERLALCRTVSRIKAKLGIPIEDSSREADVVKSVSQYADDDGSAEAIAAIYQELFRQSKLMQEDDSHSAAVGSSGESCMSGGEGSQNKHSEEAHPNYFPQVTIIGLGLIGGALARTIKRHLPETEIRAVDRQDVLEQALKEGVIDSGASELGKVVKKSSLIVLAANPDENVKVLKQIAPLLKKRQLVIDVTSTKRMICALAESLDLRGADFIGGHPFFGSERHGYESSAKLTTDGATFCIVPIAKSSEMSQKRLLRWLQLLKLKPVFIDADTHDAMAARTSHVLQLLAVLAGAGLVRQMNHVELSKYISISGSSLKQLSRLMKSPPKMWKEISLQNREEITSSLNCMKGSIDEIVTALQADDASVLDSLFSDAAIVGKLLSEGE